MNAVEILTLGSSPKRAASAEAVRQDDDARFLNEVEALGASNRGSSVDDYNSGSGTDELEAPSYGPDFGPDDDSRQTAEIQQVEEPRDGFAIAAPHQKSEPELTTITKSEPGADVQETRLTVAPRSSVDVEPNRVSSNRSSDQQSNQPREMRSADSSDTVLPNTKSEETTAHAAGSSEPVLARVQGSQTSIRPDELTSKAKELPNALSQTKGAEISLGGLNGGGSQPIKQTPKAEQNQIAQASLLSMTSVHGSGGLAPPEPANVNHSLQDLPFSTDGNFENKLVGSPTSLQPLVPKANSVGPADSQVSLGGTLSLDDHERMSFSLGDRLPATSVSGTQTGSQVQPAQVFNAQQVSQAIAVHLEATSKSGEPGHLELRLEPEELGKLRITFTPRETGFLVSFTAERSETLDLIRRHSEALLEDFERMDLAGSELAFDMREKGQEWEAIEEPDLEKEPDYDSPPDRQMTVVRSAYGIQEDRLDIRL